MLQHNHGLVAQMGERRVRNAEVMGSIPTGSTIIFQGLQQEAEMGAENEKKAIEQTIQYFFDGIDSFDGELVKKAFYSLETQMLSVTNPESKLSLGSVEKFLTTLQDAKNDPNSPLNTGKCEKTILNIDIAGTAACAKIRLKFATFAYTDYYNMLKIGGQWRIVNKIFNTEIF